MSEFLWGVYPYLCIGLFLVVPVLRMVYRPFGWTTRASGIFGRRVLGAASLLLHWGLVLLFLGHLAGFVGGLLGLGSWVTFFYWTGLVGGIAVLAGSSVALVRRIVDPEVRAMSQHDDYLVHLFLITLVGLGLYQVLALRIFGNAYPAAAWFASLWQLSPQTELMASATLVIQIHVLVALTFLAYFPFTKLVHFWSYPFNYMVRPYQAMRTLGRRFRGGWELSLRSDRSVMLAGMVVLVALAAGIAMLLGDAAPSESVGGTAAGAAAGPDGTPLAAGIAGGEDRGTLTGYPLYVSQCARCHGLDGRGEGPGAGSPTFAARPRDLEAGRYRCVSTENAVASAEDLRRTLREGMPGSGMPAFDALSEAQLVSLANVLLWIWRDRPGPGPRVEVPPRPEPTDSLLERGRQLYGALCAQCHGAEGRGEGAGADGGFEDWRGLTVRPANLAEGRLKCGTDPGDLYRRVALGIPGGAGDAQLMPGFANLPSSDVWAVATYVERELLPSSGRADGQGGTRVGPAAGTESPGSR